MVLPLLMLVWASGNRPDARIVEKAVVVLVRHCPGIGLFFPRQTYNLIQ